MNSSAGGYKLFLRAAVVPAVVTAVWCISAVRAATAQTVNTDPLNRDPAVRAAYDHFYILDYAGALERFQKIAADHPDDRSPPGTCLTQSCSENSLPPRPARYNALVRMTAF